MEAESSSKLDEESIRRLVTRLARPHRSGGRVIERASLLSSGADFDAVMEWIEANGGKPEAAVASSTHHGLHGARGGDGPAPKPLRFVLPPDGGTLA